MLMVVMLNACKRDMSDKINEVNKINQSPQFQTQSNNDYSLLDSLSTLSINIMQSISELEQNDFRALQEIINSEDEPLEKMNAIYMNAALGNVYNNLVEIAEFVDKNHISQFMDDQYAQEYYGERLLIDLEFDEYAPNNNPCAPYKGAIKACRSSFVACAVPCILAGGLGGGIALLFCINALDDCIGAANSQSANCVPSNTVFERIFIPYNLLNNC